MFEVGQRFPIYHGCAGLFLRFFSMLSFSVSSSLSAVICNCGMCCVFWVFYVVLGCLQDFGELFQLVFTCFNFLNVVSDCANCSLFEISLWFVTNCFIFFFGEFRVV